MRIDDPGRFAALVFFFIYREVIMFSLVLLILQPKLKERMERKEEKKEEKRVLYIFGGEKFQVFSGAGTVTHNCNH